MASTRQFVDLDLSKQSLVNARLNPITLAQRNALGLVAGDSGYIAYITDRLEPQIWDGTAWNSIAYSGRPIQVLVSQAALAWTASVQTCASVTLTNNVTSLSMLGSPKAATTYVLQVTQDAVGGRTLAFGSTSFIFAGGVAPVLSTAPNALDIITLYFDGTKYHVSMGKDFK